VSTTTHTRKTLVTCAVSAVVVAAAGAAALPDTPSLNTRHTASVANSSATPALTALVTPNRLYAATGAPPVVTLGPSGSLAYPDGYFVAPVANAAEPQDNGATVANPSLSFAPETFSRSTSLPDSDLPAVYNCAEIYLGLSRLTDQAAEGFGISLVEASASGIPVLAGRSGGIPEAVRHGETGLLVDAEDPDEVCRTLSILLDDPPQAQRLGRGGRSAVESYYNWERVTADLVSIGHELAAIPREVARQ